LYLTDYPRGFETREYMVFGGEMRMNLNPPIPEKIAKPNTAGY